MRDSLKWQGQLYYTRSVTASSTTLGVRGGKHSSRAEDSLLSMNRQRKASVPPTAAAYSSSPNQPMTSFHSLNPSNYLQIRNHLYVYVYVHVCMCMCGIDQRTTTGDCFSPSTTWVPGIRETIKSTANTFTC